VKNFFFLLSLHKKLRDLRICHCEHIRFPRCKLSESIPSKFVIAVDVKYFWDGLFDFKWAFKKLPKSIPEALKKDLGLG